MRWFIGILIALNLGILAWGWLGDDDERPVELAAPGVGSIRLVGEPPAAETHAVPIPAPPRESGGKAAPDGDASVSPSVAATIPKVRPLGAVAESPAEPETGESPVSVERTEPDVTAASSSADSDAPKPGDAEVDNAQHGADVVDARPVISAPEPVYVPEPEVVPAAKPARQCQRVGPFVSASAAKPTRLALAKRGTVNSVQIAGEVPAGYWVLIPPQASRTAALAVADQLKKKGIEDLWVVSKGPAKNGISLGVFSQHSNADKFAARARAKGFAVEIRAKTKSGQQTWLNYAGPTAIKPADIPKTPGVSITPRDCP